MISSLCLSMILSENRHLSGSCSRQLRSQHFTSLIKFFKHESPHERSDLSHWRKRLGDRLELLSAESLRVAHASRALQSKDLKRVTVDTTVQPKNIRFPTYAKLLHATRGATASRKSTGCSCGNPTSVSPNARR
jgi:hypothetical protein